MKLFNQNNRAISVTEYLFFITLILLVIFSFQRYLSNGLNGMWKRTGDSYGLGRQYDPNTTIECAYDMTLNLWYDVACLESFRCGAGDGGCKEKVLKKLKQCRNADCDEK